MGDADVQRVVDAVRARWALNTGRWPSACSTWWGALALLLLAAAAAAGGAVGQARFAGAGVLPPAAGGPRMACPSASTSSAPCAPMQPRGLQLTVGADPRITRAGAFLRRTGWTSCRSSSTCCGRHEPGRPAPEVPRLWRTTRRLRERALAVRPGMTDPASLAFIDEAALLAAAADPEREYIEQSSCRQAAACGGLCERATLAGPTVLRAVACTLCVL
jgi:hypothetical protein